MWVRCRSGPFKGDLACLAIDLNEVATDADVVLIRIVPRIAYDLTDTSKKWGKQCALFNKERVASMYESHRITNISTEGVPVLRFRRNTYSQGLLNLPIQRRRLERAACPDPDEISLFAESGFNPPFMAATQLAHSKRSWRCGNHVKVVRGETIGAVGEVMSIDIDQWWYLYLWAASHPASCSYRWITYGGIIGRGHSPGVSTQNLISVPDWALQSYTPNGPIVSASDVRPPRQSLDANNHYKILKGDHANVIAEEHAGKEGFVHDRYYDQSNEEIVIVELFLPNGKLGGNLFSMPRRNVRCSPPRAVVSFTTARGYDVKPGDKVQVLRGKHWGIRGMVKSVDAVMHSLILTSDEDNVEIEVPCYHASVTAKAQPEIQSQRLKGRKVIIVGGHYKSYRGTIHAISGPSYTISLEGLGELRQVPAEDLVDMSTGMRLNGVLLSATQLQEFLKEYERNHGLPTCPSTPIPSSSTPNVERPEDDVNSAWNVNERDRADVASCSRPAAKTIPYSFLFDESICKNLGGRRIWVKFSSRFIVSSMAGRHSRTEAPSRFWSPDHKQAGEGKVAVEYTPQSGGRPRHVFVAADVLSPGAPSGIGQECMVLKGDRKGEILRLVRYNKRDKTVSCVGGIVLDLASVCRVEAVTI
ncbi:hypothetical protein BJ138DRAFT_1120863 [Hygrophoropsis aurantiaca]|uniref:Uncharacterized protein n=1 Tax=Hygrophoropsis aurantiaca TaxID=72124 RepID=A0ACB7ZPI7_9AGAM|nr:hypothetical protein BJ138DRAFT_1120863 [Hygrophoropsis aurantiaca]